MKQVKASNITIYSKPHCDYCILLKTLLNVNKIGYIEYNVLEDKEKLAEMFTLIKKSPIPAAEKIGVPVTNWGGEIIIGFQENRLLDLVKIYGKSNT